jgi:hypothetical protein
LRPAILAGKADGHGMWGHHRKPRHRHAARPTDRHRQDARTAAGIWSSTLGQFRCARGELCRYDALTASHIAAAKIRVITSQSPQQLATCLRYAPTISGIMHEVVRDTSHNGFDFP